MIRQKITALAERPETQARDVFDVDLLLRQWPADAPGDHELTLNVDIAIGRVLGLPFESYESLVIRFLDPDVVELYNRPEHWHQMQERVIAALKGLR